MILRDALGPETFERLLAAIDRSSDIHLPGSISNADQILSWKTLGQIVSAKDLTKRQLMLARPGARINPNDKLNYDRPDPIKDKIGTEPDIYSSLLTEGRALILNGVHDNHPPIYELCADLSWYFNINVGANMYASWEHDSPFGIHWDEHDVIVLQMEGKKRWKLFDNKVDFRPNQDDESEVAQNDEPRWERVLEKGDILYIPRGRWHSVEPVGEPSLHITVGLKHPVMLEIFDILKELAENDPIFWQKLSGNPTQEDFEKLKQCVAEKFPDLLARANHKVGAKHFHSLVRKRPRISFPGVGISSASSLNGTYASLDASIRLHGVTKAGALILTDSRRKWTFPEPAKETILRIVNKGMFEVRSLVNDLMQAGIPATEAERIVTHSIQQGIFFIQ